jgi:hypothetical protein
MPAVAFTPAELMLLREALVTPTCWDPARRKRALALLERKDEQLSLLAEASSG